MLVVSPLIALVMAISVWLFVRLSPVGADAIAVRRFNRASFALCIVGCLAIFGWAYASLAGTPDSAWWPVIGALYCTVAVPLLFVIAALVRSRVCRSEVVIKAVRPRW